MLKRWLFLDFKHFPYWLSTVHNSFSFPPIVTDGLNPQSDWCQSLLLAFLASGLTAFSSSWCGGCMRDCCFGNLQIVRMAYGEWCGRCPREFCGNSLTFLLVYGDLSRAFCEWGTSKGTNWGICQAAYGVRGWASCWVQSQSLIIRPSF